MTTITISLAKACYRTGVSDRAAAIIARSVFPNDTSKDIDRSNIRREKSKTRQ